MLARDLVRAQLAERYFVISDRRVARLHGRALQQRLQRHGLRVDLLTFPAGEAAKTRATKATLEERLFRAGAGRDCAILAVGGGVSGDLGGFVAATWQRGVPLVQVPTTLLAMVDASIGGKTAVNLATAKNLVGAIHQPHAVYADTATLDTLPQAVYCDGIAEIVKGAAIADIGFFRWLEAHVDALLARQRPTLAEAIARSVRIKSRVVRADENELGRRAALNFGHTIGHALEALGGYRLSHGRAVSIGMVVESRLAVACGSLSETHALRLRRLLVAFGLPVELPRGLLPGPIVRATRHDKKARAGRVRYALPVALGRMPSDERMTVEIETASVLAALRGS